MVTVYSQVKKTLKKNTLFQNLLWAGIFVLLAWAVAFFSYRSFRAIIYRYPLDFVEGLLLDQTNRVSHLTNLYPTDFSQPPYLPTAYPPLFHFLFLPFYMLFGNAYWYGRLLNAIMYCVISWLIVKITQSLTRDILASVTAGLLFLAIPYVVSWSPLLRVDGLALLFSVLALYTVVTRKVSRVTLLWTAVFSYCAVMVRQTYLIAVPSTVFFWLVIKAKYAEAKVYAQLVAIPLATSFIIFNYLTRGGFFLNTVLINAKMDFVVEFLFGYPGELLTKLPFFITLVCLFLFYVYENKQDSKLLVFLYLFFTSLVTLFIVKAGSNINYLLELSVAVCIAIGLVVAQAHQEKNFMFPFVAIMIIFQLALSNIWIYYHRHFLKEDKTFQRNYQELYTQHYQMVKLAELFKSTSGPILVDDIGVGVLPLVGKGIYIEPFAMNQMQKHGLWDDSQLVTDIQQHTFPLIMIITYRQYDNPNITIKSGGELKEHNIGMWWSNKTYDAIYNHYQIEGMIGNFIIFRPKYENSST